MHSAPRSNGHGAFSASVRLSLRIAGERLELAQVGPTWLSFDQAVALKSRFATLAIEIDGQADLTEIELDRPERKAREFDYILRA
jgi:hypothetical protein